MTKDTADRLWKIFSGPLKLLGYGLSIFVVFFALKTTGLFTEVAGFLSFRITSHALRHLCFWSV